MSDTVSAYDFYVKRVGRLPQHRESAAAYATTGLVCLHGATLQRVPVDTGKVHGPERPAIIAWRYDCPSCDAPAGEPCRLSPTMVEQFYSHVSRHRSAQRAEWRRLMFEMDRPHIYSDVPSSIRIARVAS